MAFNSSPSDIESQLRDLIQKLSSSLTDCRVNINTLKTKVAHSRNHNHLAGVHNLDNRLANINDKTLELGAYQKSGMAARLSFMSAGIHTGSVWDIAKSLKVKLQALIRDVNLFSSDVKAEAEMSMIELLRVKPSNVSLVKFLVYLFSN